MKGHKATERTNTHKEYLHEIDRRKKAEKQVKQSEAHLEQNLRIFDTALSNTPDFNYVFDRNHRFIYVNKPLLNLWGKTMEEVYGKNFQELGYPPELVKLHKKQLNLVLKTKKPVKGENAYTNFEGNTGYYEYTFVPVFGKDRTIEAIAGTTHDVTERKKLEELQRKESENRFKNLVEHSSDAIVLNNVKGMITYASPSIKNLLGYNPEEFLKKNPAKIIHPDDLQQALDLFQSILQKPEKVGRLQYRILHKNKQWIWVEGTLSNLLRTPGIEGIVINLRNITERKVAQAHVEQLNKELKDMVNELETLIELVPIGIGISEDPKATRIKVNKVFREMLRVRPGQNASKTAPKNQGPGFTVIRNGKKVPGHDLPMQKAGLTGKPVSNDVIDIVHQDGTVLNLLSSAVPIFDDNKKVRIVAGAFLDITQRKKLEQQKDDFLGVASHELKTPVTSLKAYTEVLRLTFKKKGDFKSVELLTKMDNQLNKLTTLISDLLDVTKIQAGKLQFREEYFDFNEVVSETAEEVQRTATRHKIIIKMDKSRIVYGDRERTGQVITNFLTNAIKYSPNAKKIIITTKIEKENIILGVQDFGLGIHKEKQARVFERFYRVQGEKEYTYPGLGLGLYISGEIIRRQGGKIWVKSKEGNGSTFFFSLPLHKQKSRT